MIKLSKSTQGLGWKIQLHYAIGLHISDLDLLKEIKTFFGEVGTLTTHKDVAIYSVRSIKEIIKIILPHFDNYPLQTQKKADYLLFKKAALILKDKKHLSPNGLQEIVNIRSSMNKGLTSNLIKSFPNTIPVERPIILFQDYHPEWIAGFVSVFNQLVKDQEGDGGFSIRASKTDSDSTMFHLSLVFYITQHIKDTNLIKSFKPFFKCGTFSLDEDTITFKVARFEDIYNIIIPFFTQYKVKGLKSSNFNQWTQAATIIKNKMHLTKQGQIELIKIKNMMNKNRFNIL